jgi:hypothetical protein
MKRLKFSDGLPELIINGKKSATWRINDEKNLSVGDELSLCRADGKEFAKAKITYVKETIFGEMAKQDKTGHENFKSDKEMYETFSEYYKDKVTQETKVKIIKFRLIN